MKILLNTFANSTKDIKKFLATAALCALLLYGCGSSPGEPAEEDASVEETVTADITEETVNEDNINGFVTLGDYIGIEYEPVSVAPVTNEDVQEIIKQHLTYDARRVEITDRAAMTGDTVVIDFQGFLNGIAFEGGTAEGYELSLGAGSLVLGFEEQIAGHMTGDEFEIPITFPDGYRMPELSGQATVFNIKLHTIYEIILPELTDEYVQQFNVASVAEYEKLIRQQLAEENESVAENELKGQIWTKIVNDSSVLKYPQDEVNFRTEQGLEEFEYYSLTYNIAMEELVPQITGMELEDFIEANVKPIALQNVGQDLILRAIAAKEGITLTDEELNAEVGRIVERYGYENADAFWAQNDIHAVKLSFLSEKVMAFIIENAVVMSNDK